MPMRSIRYLGLFGDLRFGVGHLSFGEVVVRSFYVFVINLFIIHGVGFFIRGFRLFLWSLSRIYEIFLII
jgi:hypothetical protein